jgi:hypothetical protein
MAESSSPAIAMNLFTAPRAAFAVLRERPRVWLPLLVLFAGYTAVALIYMNQVDLGWFMDQQISQNPNLTEQQRADAVTNAMGMPASFYGAIGAVSSIVLISVVLFVTALYYTVVSFASRDGVRLRQWFALVCWCTLPAWLSLVAQIVSLFVNDVRFMPQDAINPLSFGNLMSVATTPATPVVQRILLAMDFTIVWSSALSVIGYRMWTNSSLTKSVLVVLAPLAVLVAVGTLVSMR